MRYSAPTLLSIIVMSLLSSACTVFGVESVEEAPFELVRKEKPYEIRDYEALVVAETWVNADYKKAGNQAFRKLFSYISGDNEGQTKIAMTAPVIADANSADEGEKIAMTAPVTSQKEGDAWRYRFVLPRSYTIETAPRPTNPDVALTQIPEKRVAIRRYSGRATEQAQLMNVAKLVEWMAAQGLEPLSEPRYAGYNAPWTLPAFRRNEVLIDVAVP